MLFLQNAHYLLNSESVLSSKKIYSVAIAIYIMVVRGMLLRAYHLLHVIVSKAIGFVQEIS